MSPKIWFSGLSVYFLLTQMVYGGEGGGDALLSPNPGLAIWTLITFLVVLVVLRAFAWKPLMESLENRANYIENMIKDADEKHRKAEETLREYEKKLESAKQEALAILEEGKKDAEERKKKILEEAEKEASHLKEQAKKEIDLATKKAKEEIWNQAVEISTSLAEKIIGKTLSSQDDQRLIKEALEEYRKN